MTKSVANSIGNMRRAMGWTQMEVADRIGVRRSAVAMWETGKATPRASMLIELAKLFDVTIDELLTESVPDQAKKG